MGRRENVIIPAIKECGLEPIIVDTKQISDSIITEIMAGVTSARLILGDITSVRGHRNGNVMYEVGIAHSLRQPQEVILFRSDKSKLLFDLSNIRVNRYDPAGSPSRSKEIVTRAIQNAIREIDLTKSAMVQQTVRSLSKAPQILLIRASTRPLEEPPHATMRDAVSYVQDRSAIERLLELGCLEAVITDTSGVPGTEVINFTYKTTSLGRAVADYLIASIVQIRSEGTG